MPETDLQKHAIIESFLQPNFSSKIWQILTMGDNLEFHKMTFCGSFIYCSIRIWKEIIGQVVLSSTLILSKIWLSHCNQMRDTASHRDLREFKGTPEKWFRDRNVKMCR